MRFQIKHGTTRTAILIWSYAFKIPILKYGWKMFLQGLLANLNEVMFSRMKDERLCPVLHHLPLGFLNIMPRAETLTDSEWQTIDWDYFFPPEGFKIPSEDKRCSFGTYNGKIVSVDYGN